MTARAGEVGEWKDEYKEKGLIDMDNSIMIVGVRGYRGINGNGK